MIYHRPVHRTIRSQAHRRSARARPAGRVISAWLIGLASLVAVGAVILGRPADQHAAAANVAGGTGSPTDSAQAEATIPLTAASASASARAAILSPGRQPALLATTATNVYAGAGAGMFSPAVANIPARVYVPDEANGTVTVIDPRTFRILYRFRVGSSPEHVTPDWDLKRLYVEAAFSNLLTVIDPKTGRPVGRHTVPGPYNLYFTVDGRMAIVVLDSSISGSRYAGAQQLYFYNRRTWRLIKAVRVPWAGADHLDFSADGRYVLVSTEYSGWIAKVDIRRMVVVDAMFVGGKPVDVRLAPDGRVFYVANQAASGVAIIDPVAMRRVGFIRTGAGAHGLAISRDARWLYVTNRNAGSLSVIDFRTRSVIHTWHIGGTPDMIAVSPDGTQLWISNRYSGTVSVIDSHTGHVIRIIRVGGHPHGLAYFPEPGAICLGHNGIYR
jgi:YVTN family beta-propeller protein